MLSRILVLLDERPATAALLPALRGLVGGTGSLVHLLTVRPPVRDLEQCGDRLLCLDELWAHERRVWLDYLERQGSQLAYDGVVVEREVRFGDPVAETLGTAERHAMHLIALAAEPQTWLARLLRPSVAQRLLERAAVPVLTLPAERPPWQGVVLHFDRVTA